MGRGNDKVPDNTVADGIVPKSVPLPDDSITGFYYVSSRYYDPEIGRWLNVDSLLSQISVLGNNLFAYCENNPVNKTDSSGRLGIGTLIGAAVGGLIGGVGGAISALVSGKSVTAGAVTGAATGALIGLVCGYVADAIASGGLTLLSGAALSAGICGAAAVVGNLSNQLWNYHVEVKEQVRSNKENLLNTSSTTANEKLTSVSFLDYIDYKSVVMSGVTAAVFAPLSVVASCVVNSAFWGVETGGTKIMAEVIANFAMGGNLSILQSIIELF